MKLNTSAAVGGFAVWAAVVLAAGQAQALSLYGSATGSIQAGVGAAATIQATTTVNTSANVGVGIGTTATASQTGNASGSVSAAALLLLNEPVSITTTADLATYDDLVVKARPAVTAINFDDNNNVMVAYSQPAKLFGIFPTTISGQVTVDAQGNTAVTLPWWSLFYAKDTAGVQASVAGAVAQSGANFTASAQADVPTRLQNEARVIDAVTAALQAQVVASTSVTAQ